MTKLCWFILWLVYARAMNAVDQAEEHYRKGEYDKVMNALKRTDETSLTNSQRAVVSRIRGHICMFGQGRDKGVDLSCAWKNYVSAAKKGDPESYFFVGFMLSNFLFNDINVIQELFEDFELNSMEVFEEAVEKIKVTASICYYISSLKGYLPAIIAMGYRLKNKLDDCNTSIQYYTKAAQELLISYSETIYLGGVSKKYILAKADPYRDREEEIDPEYALRTLSSIPIRVDKLGLLTTIASYLFRNKRYTEASDIFSQILLLQPSNSIANYCLGVMLLLGLGCPVNYENAIRHLSMSAVEYEEAANALGVAYHEGYGVSKNTTIAKNYFKKAADNGSVHGTFNAFIVLLDEVGITSDETLFYLVEAAKSGHPRASYFVGSLKLHANKTCESIKYLKSAIESQLWENYYKDVHQYYVGKQKKVATLYYMLMGEIGNSVAQVNAGNLLDDNEFFNTNSWITKHNHTSNLDKHLAFKYYKMAESQGETVVYKRLSDFYYFGLAPDPDRGLYFYYLLQALMSKNSLSILAQISFDLGTACQFGLVPDFDCDYTMEAYNLSRALHPSGYFPGTIMMYITEWWEKGIRPNLCSVYILPYVLLLLWLIVPMVFIYKRRI